MGKRRGRQTRYKRRVRWGRLFASLFILAAIVGAGYLMVRLLSGENSTLSDLLPQKSTPTSMTAGASADLPPAAPTPPPTLPPDLALNPQEGTDPASFGFTTGLMINKEEASSFTRDGSLSFGGYEDYTAVPGILTFGGNNYRNTFTYGTQKITNATLTRKWAADTGSLSSEQNGTWTGTGWTGMPLIVQWPAATRKVLGVKEEFKNKADFTEVIYPAMDGKIHFIELSSGERTREPIDIGVVTKGTASVDPRGYPLLYTGQGVPGTQDGIFGSWFRIIDLIENKVTWSFGGKDRFAHRAWQAYDSSALIHAGTDTLIAPGENGVLYTVKLNTSFDPEAGTVSVDPGNLEKYRYKGDGYGFSEEPDKRWAGIENSISVFRNYAYFTDNGGRLQCVDLNTLQLQFVVDVTDDSDTSPVLEEDVANNTFYLYTASEVDKQEGALSAGKGTSYHRKIDGRTGKILWEKEQIASVGNASSNGGTLSTPHVGRGNISDMVIYTSTLVPVGEDGDALGGRIIAYDKQTGAELWRYEQANFKKDDTNHDNGYWSSPVVVYDENEKAYLIQCDRNGMIRVHDPRDNGKVINEYDAGSRIESTPAVFQDYLVVGTRGVYGSGESQKILCYELG